MADTYPTYSILDAALDGSFGASAVLYSRGRVVDLRRAEKLDFPPPIRLSNGAPDPLRRRRHLDVAYPEFGKRIDDRVDHDGEGRCRAAFSAGAHPEPIGRRRHFAECRRERRQRVGSRHRIIHEAGREELAGPWIVVAIFEQRLAGALGDAAMCLAMQD